jgi:hypothetical protein
MSIRLVGPFGWWICGVDGFGPAHFSCTGPKPLHSLRAPGTAQACLFAGLQRLYDEQLGVKNVRNTSLYARGHMLNWEAPDVIVDEVVKLAG